MAYFERPSAILGKENKFSKREVGLTHPDQPAYMRIADNGDIHIMANDNVGIIISAAQNTIILVADNVKFLTKEDEGLRWNNLAFNAAAVKYSEPAFIYPKNQTAGIYDGISDYID